MTFKEEQIQNYFLTLSKTNRSLGNYVAWNKVKKNTEKHKMNLAQLNILTRAKNISDLKDYVSQIFGAGREDVFNSLDILIAKRDDDREYLNEETLEINKYSFSSVDEVLSFIKKTNLIELFQSVNSLEDYVFGVEVGLDTNGRKNRGGSIMEFTIRKMLNDHNINFEEQVHLKNVKGLSMDNKKIKRVDFMFELNGYTYLIESSFYNASGSKISETCNSYVNFTNKLNNKFKMIWVADGKGMQSIKKLLNEQWDNLEIINIRQFENILDKINI